MHKLKKWIGHDASNQRIRAKNVTAGIPSRPSIIPVIQNFHLVWLDGSIDEINNDDCRNSITNLRQIVNRVTTCTDVDECIDFINSNKEEKIFMISSGSLGQTTIPMIHDKSQISTIYIFCGNKARHEIWITEWPKIKGVFTDITPICQALKQTTQEYDHDSVSISFVQKNDGSSNENPDTLDQSFMYVQMLKEILLTMNFDQSHINDFLTYCRTELAGNTAKLRNVESLCKKYHDHEPIWWYTHQPFVYSMFTKALRSMEIDLIIKTGFFVRDLHNHITKLYAEQNRGQNRSDSFTLYRGQGLSHVDFDQLKTTQGGLLSFNSFLLTSKDRNVSLDFARQTAATPDLIGVLFVMKIDPSISTIPFANVADLGYYQVEEEDDEEILFSIHSVFRIEQVKQIDGNNRLYQVDLTLTSDNDSQLLALTQTIQEEKEESTGWFRLGKLMIKLGQVNKAEELYKTLLRQPNDEATKAHLFHHLGMVKNNQGKYEEAIKYYENSIKIEQKILHPTHPDLATSYNSIGGVYDNIKEYSTALSYYEKALEIRQKTLPENPSHLATSYNNIGLVYNNMEEYLKALSFHEKVLSILRKTLPKNHLLLATSENNIGLVYYNMRQYSKAISYYEKALEIRQKTLPANHPDLATSYNNIATIYDKIGAYSKALSYYEKVLEIDQNTLPANHPDLATSYNNIGWVYRNKNDYAKALSYYQHALDIKQRLLPHDHPDLKDMKKNIDFVKKKL